MPRADSMNTTWREELTEAMTQRGESWADVEACTLDDAGLDKAFNSGFGSSEGAAFTCWTTKSVYFPVTYDGSESVGFVSRHPDGKPTGHWGGE